MMKKLYNIYFGLPNFSILGLPGKGINYIMLKLTKKAFDIKVPSYLKKTAFSAGSGINSDKRDEKYIVSLTSFPARINQIWITIETLLRQKFKPDAVILYLALEQFENRKLPQSLLDLIVRGLTIKFVSDLRSHTKYFYSFQEYHDCNVITVDDDCYYPEDTLETLVMLHRKYPGVVCANRVHKIAFDRNGIMKPYRQWAHNHKNIIEPSFLLLPTGVGGVLYPPNVMHPNLFMSDIFKEKCFFADDIWLKIHEDLLNTKAVTSIRFNKDLVTISNTQHEKLVTSNSFFGGNDEQLQSLLNFYKIKIKK